MTLSNEQHHFRCVSKKTVFSLNNPSRILFLIQFTINKLLEQNKKCSCCCCCCQCVFFHFVWQINFSTKKNKNKNRKKIPSGNEFRYFILNNFSSFKIQQQGGREKTKQKKKFHINNDDNKGRNMDRILFAPNTRPHPLTKTLWRKWKIICIFKNEIWSNETKWINHLCFLSITHTTRSYMHHFQCLDCK